jgi:shikimate kinase
MTAMKMFLLGAPCAGKTTLVLGLREVLSCPVLDMDEELVRVNGGTWPASGVKRSLSSRVLDEASALGGVVLAHSRLDAEQLASLVAHGWVIALLDVPEAVLRARAQERLARDGWSNVEWLPVHLEDIADLRGRQVFSHVLDANQPTTALVRAVVDLMSTASATD